MFPFYYDNVLYYGCTDDPVDPLCATVIDEDFLATEMAKCNQFCHVQSEWICNLLVITA